MLKKIICLILSSFIAIQTLLGVLSPNAFASAAEDTVISSEEDFRKFVENCVIDSYSSGKTFVLDNDLNILGMKIPAVPIFDGIFDGNGHKISGISFTEDSSAVGLFRYIGEQGIVRNLTVEGMVAPIGTASRCGGIAGVNRGKIEGCTFSGAVSGKGDCGGIAGINEKTGIILKCEASGKVNASHRAGGICGTNEGTIRSCTNKCLVDSVVSDGSIDIQDLNLEQLKSSSDTLVNISDGGGIAGLSHGTIQGCVNKGTIGYPHVGYNIGGIAGRQDGYVSSCTNYGQILGRKDCGGIVGQAEPYFMIEYDNTQLNRLKTAAEELNDLAEQLINDAENGADSVSGSFGNINSALDKIRVSSDSMLREADRIVNTDVNSVNELETRLYDFIDRLGEIVDVIGSSGSNFENCIGALKDAMNLLGNCGEYLNSGVEQMFSASDKLADAFGKLAEASASIGDALDSLKKGLGDPERMKASLEALEKDIETVKFAANSIADNANALIKALKKFENDSDIKASVNAMEKALTDMSKTAGQLSEELDSISKKLDNTINSLPNNPTAEQILDAVKALMEDEQFIESVVDALKDIAKLAEELSDFSKALSDFVNSEALKEFKDDISKVLNSIESDTSHISDMTDNSVTTPDLDVDALYKVIDYLKEASSQAEEAVTDGEDVVNIIKGAWDYLDNAAEYAIAAAYCAQTAAEEAQNAVVIIEDAVNGISDMLDYFSGLPKVNFIGADEEFVSSRDALSDELADFKDCLDVLNASADNAVGVVADDLREINGKIDELEKILSDIVEEVVDNTSKKAEDYVEDISVAKLGSKGNGTVYSCFNYGSIEADVNVGGISGAMGVENTVSLESDDADSVGNRSMKFTYMLRTVVNRCSNYGYVTSKKDGAGGVVGSMSTGCVNECGGFGKVSSSSGGYVGGVAGISAGSVLKSAAMCEVSGNKNVGGIAGSGNDIKNCRSFVYVNGGEFTGAVAGEITGEYEDNAFVENGTGGVDGISYKGKAYPTDYYGMVGLNYVPADFRKMRLIFIADGETVGEVDCVYGGAVKESDIPDVPEKDGYNGSWEDFERKNITFGAIINAVYRKPVSVAASDVFRDDGLPVLLVEGAFTDDELPGAVFEGDGWHITIPDDGSSEHRVRYYCEGDSSKTDVLVNGSVVKSECDGRYLVFTTNMNSFTLTTADKPLNIAIPITIGSAVVLTVIIAVIVIQRKNKKKSIQKT